MYFAKAERMSQEQLTSGKEAKKGDSFLLLFLAIALYK